MITLNTKNKTRFLQGFFFSLSQTSLIVTTGVNKTRRGKKKRLGLPSCGRSVEPSFFKGNVGKRNK